MTARSSSLLCCLACASIACGQENLSFESTREGTPIAWVVGGDGFDFAADETISYEGSKSLRILRATEVPLDQASFGVASQSMDVRTHGGDRIGITAVVKTREVNVGYAGLWLRVDGPDGMLFLDNMFDRPLTGTADWQRIRIGAMLAEEAQRVIYGALLPGSGTAWFDDFTVDLVDPISLPPPTPEVVAYVSTALDLMGEHSIRRDEIDWEEFRAYTLQSVRGIVTIGGSHFALRAAVARLGDHHSTFIAPVLAKQIATAGRNSEILTPWVSPRSELLDGGVGYVTVPAYIGTDADRQTRYADELQAAIANVDSTDVCGWIVDLRQNGGGNVFPMLAGIGPILGNGDASEGILVDGTTRESWYRDGQAGSNEYVRARVSGEPYRLSHSDPPVALLIGPRTASAGEFIAGAFIGRQKTRLFGLPSAGATTGSAPYFLEDGAVLNLAMTVMADRTGRAYGGPIVPDEPIANAQQPEGPLLQQTTVQRALAWLRQQYECP